MAEGATRTLTLIDAQPNNDWREAGFQPVGSATIQQAIGTTLPCISSPRTLEFRFAQNAGDFKATVAQDMGSKSSSEELEWALIVDGRQLETKRIAFKDVAEFTTPLAGVAVVQLSVKLSSTRCQGGATALVTSVIIAG